MAQQSGKPSAHSFIPSFATLLLLQSTLARAGAVNVDRIAVRAGVSDCLTGLNVTLPGEPAFDSQRQTFNARLSYTPAAIVLPTSIQQVEQLVSCGASLGVPVVARSGGHSYAGYGLGGVDGALVCDLSALKNISLNGNSAVVQTGNRLGELATYLWENGQLALPHGTCPKVGTGGHTSYGGYGPFSRMGGLLMDRVTSAEVVLANGTSATASTSSNPDLFWALKGAAPSFGIVTSWTYSTLQAPARTVVFTIDLPTYTAADAFATAFSQYQTFVHTAPKELAMAFSLGPNGNGGIGVQLLGNYFGSKPDFTDLVSNLVASLGATVGTADEYTDWIKVLVANGYGEQLVTAGPSPPNTFFAKSLITTDLLDNSSITSWGNYLMQTAANADINWFAQVDLYGGAISSDFDSNSASFAHRDAFLVFQLYGSSVNDAPYPADGIEVINNMLTSISPNPIAAYPNYIDPTLSAQQWQSLYFGSNIQRLGGIKAVYDPRNVFSFPQSIPVGDAASATVISHPSGTQQSTSQSNSAARFYVSLGFIVMASALQLVGLHLS